MQPKISLIIPCYNVEKYVRECLESALQQTLNDIEIICVNDGSTDATPQILREFAARDDRVVVIDKPNSGYGATMNAGLDRASGKYIGILESDDFLELDALACLYKAAEDAQADIAKADFYLYWSQPKPRDERFGWVRPTEAGMHNPREFTNVFLRKSAIWSAIYRRDFLATHDIRFLETPGASFQDTSFNFKAWACAKNIVLLDRAVLHYRQDNEASSVNSPEKVFCICDEYDEIMRFIHERNEDCTLGALAVKMRFDNYMWNYERLAPELRLQFAKRMAEDFRKDDAAGITNYDMLEPWKVVDRKAVMADPEAFCAEKEDSRAPGKLGTLTRCFKAGGLPLVARAITSKIRNEGY